MIKDRAGRAEEELEGVGTERAALRTLGATREVRPLGEAMARDAQEGPIRPELRARLRRTLDAKPIGDPTVAWSRKVSPFPAVAHIRAEPQEAWTEARGVHCDPRFPPWTGLPAHQPPGGISRLACAAFRERVDRRAP